MRKKKKAPLSQRGINNIYIEFRDNLSKMTVFNQSFHDETLLLG